MGHYNYFRSYSAERGRYTQADPIGLEGGFNRFGYVGGNGLQYADAFGLKPGDIFPSPDAAALDAGNHSRGINPQFIEYGGWVYPEKGGYTYNLTKGSPGGMPRDKMEKLRLECPSPPVSSWHTHPMTETPDKDFNSFSADDMNFGKYYRVPVYLKTPAGPTLIYDPATGKIRGVK